MNVNKIIIILLTFSLTYSYGQPPCNRDSKTPQLAKRIPASICLPTGYNFIFDYPFMDINGDSIKDKIIEWARNPLNDGDTIFISVYIGDKESNWKLLKTFKNIYPVFFHSYNYEYKLNKKLSNIRARYHGNNPLENLKFQNDLIELQFKTEENINIINYYKYKKEVNNWILIRQKEIDVTTEFKILRDEIPQELQTIDNFNYLDYL